MQVLSSNDQISAITDRIRVAVNVKSPCNDFCRQQTKKAYNLHKIMQNVHLAREGGKDAVDMGLFACIFTREYEGAMLT